MYQEIVQNTFLITRGASLDATVASSGEIGIQRTKAGGVGVAISERKVAKLWRYRIESRKGGGETESYRYKTLAECFLEPVGCR